MTALLAGLFEVDFNWHDFFVILAVFAFLVGMVLSVRKQPHVLTVVAFGLASFAFASLFLTP